MGLLFCWQSSLEPNCRLLAAELGTFMLLVSQISLTSKGLCVLLSPGPGCFPRSWGFPRFWGSDQSTYRRCVHTLTSPIIAGAIEEVYSSDSHSLTGPATPGAVEETQSTDTASDSSCRPCYPRDNAQMFLDRTDT